MLTPVLSVVIPTFARPQQLHRCLSALAVQTFSEPWEVVVVDDGSPEPISLPASLQPEQPLNPPDCSGHLSIPIRLIRQANSGPAMARNHGVDCARGKMIAFTDDDCQPCPSWLDELIKAIRRYPGAMIGGTTLNALPEDVCASASQLIVDMVYKHFNHDSENAYFLASNNILCSKQHFQTLGGFDPRFRRAGAEDRDFCDRWRQAGLRLVWQHSARIEHHHHQTVSQYINLHTRYGRGAFLYQAKRRASGTGSMSKDMGFHASLPARLLTYASRTINPWRTIKILFLLILWQTANAYGFAREALHARLGTYNFKRSLMDV